MIPGPLAQTGNESRLWRFLSQETIAQTAPYTTCFFHVPRLNSTPAHSASAENDTGTAI